MDTNAISSIKFDINYDTIFSQFHCASSSIMFLLRTLLQASSVLALCASASLCFTAMSVINSLLYGLIAAFTSFQSSVSRSLRSNDALPLVIYPILLSTRIVVPSSKLLISLPSAIFLKPFSCQLHTISPSL